MFRKLLIANRGEIAVRIARTCRELGIGVVAVYSDADRAALHVRVADEAYRIGPPPARESYLDVDAIVAAARESGAEAVHPGYGFLAENATFAERVEAAGIVFVGPSPAAIRAMGDKAEAKRLVAAAGVPVVPGYDGAEQSLDRLSAEAERIGFPILIKAVAGGGGRGMREVRDAEAFAGELESARREALGAFGDDRVLLERLVEGARHVEVQVFGDAHGNYVYLGERDCSVQRRHQKVIEEAPSPAVDEALRRRMGEAAVLAARGAGYTNAGTVEFLLDNDRNFYFLEMNTRLQVEHPVTEFITGLDLVRLQLEVACGQPLPLREEDVRLNGHAIEVRLYAEDPARGYLPSSGRLRRMGLPESEGIRIDTAFAPGDLVSPYYDSMLLKLIAGGADRQAALDRLAQALEDAFVYGVTTNLALLRTIVAGEAFRTGAVTVDYLDQHPELAAQPSRPTEQAVLAAAGFLLTDAGKSDRAERDPWRAAGPWRLAGGTRPVPLAIDGRLAVVSAQPDAVPGHWTIETEAGTHAVEYQRAGTDELIVRSGHDVTTFENYARHRGLQNMTSGDRSYWYGPAVPQTPDAAASAVQSAGGDGVLTAPMPGLIVKLNVAEGDRVRAHQTLAVLEAMKMEHAIQAGANARVKRVHVREGERVSAGATLIELEPLASEAGSSH